MPRTGSPIALRTSSSVTFTSTVLPVASSRPVTTAALPAGRRERRADRDLDLLGGLLADRDPVLVADVLLHGGVEVEAAERRRAPAHDAAHRDDRHLRPPAADVDDRWPDRLVHGQARRRSRPRAAPRRGSPAARPPNGSRPRSRGARPPSSSTGTATSTRGRGNRTVIVRRITTSIMRWVMSNSVIVPCRSGRTASTLPESPPSSCQASSPIASTSPVSARTATTVGLVEHDAVALAVDERVRGAEVDREVAPHSQLPITQWASPETRPSFFQMGTSCFRRSMPWRQASNASARCGADTATIDARLADRELARPMHDRDPADRPPLEDARRRSRAAAARRARATPRR